MVLTRPTTPDAALKALETDGLAEGGDLREGPGWQVGRAGQQPPPNSRALSVDSFGFDDRDLELGPGGVIQNQQLRAVVVTEVTNGMLYRWDVAAPGGAQYVAVDFDNGPQLFTRDDLGQTDDAPPRDRLILVGNDPGGNDFFGAARPMVVSYYVVSSSYEDALFAPNTTQPHDDIPANDDDKHTSALQTLTIPLIDWYDERPMLRANLPDEGGLKVNPVWRTIPRTSWLKVPPPVQTCSLSARSWNRWSSTGYHRHQTLNIR